MSRLFDPVVEIPLMLSVTVWWALTNGLRWRFLLFLLLVDALAPAIYMFYGLRKGFISDWDISKRGERYRLYLVTILAHLVGVIFAFLIGKTELGLILLVFWSLAVVFALVTYYWKISVHAGVNGVMLAFFNHFWGWSNYWWLILVLLLVLWARVEIKKHNWLQVTIGAGLAIGWIELGLRNLIG